MKPNLTNQVSNENVSIKKDIPRRRSMKMTTKGQYAIVALTHMKKRFNKGETAPIRISEISEKENISAPYLEQLFRKLRRAGIVASIRGPGGGYVFTAGTITYKQILEAVGEKVSFGERISDHSEASKDVAGNLNGVHETLTKAFGSMSI